MNTPTDEFGRPLKKTLWAIAEERWAEYDGHMQWVPNGIVHVHAYDYANAKFVYLSTKDRNCRSVAIGPVIGYHVLDEHGEILKA